MKKITLYDLQQVYGDATQDFDVDYITEVSSIEIPDDATNEEIRNAIQAAHPEISRAFDEAGVRYGFVSVKSDNPDYKDYNTTNTWD